MKKHAISFKFAAKGIYWAFRTQPNFRIHLILSIIVIDLGFYFSISYFEWLILSLVITVGLVIEMVNTSIEATTDAIDKTIRPDIAIAKDVASGAMLIYAIGAIVIAFSIFVPRIFDF
ncbi:hypothetical protein A3J15_03390 [Candidatus Roizmanbacteria bacterium RIFCSPLOWO2_02_FULL_38_10]|uniref:Diacylglycerol kinase n=1 Tax=Candidatus Roizmanbacteria bacterium RIFCSPLOWO2_02_FULL_38_10 TaxID=1802074 RepID=A0A1F7JMX9_9BACT|nr:MAG: hypothetical protein A3J15_03390 [Candidatus Roizmanbacteria bacterium RIFCSPLOWO2_02_FULL_38_10]